MTCAKTTGTLVLALLLAACTGEVARDPGDGGPFQQVAEAGATPSEKGDPASCNPVSGEGCASGQCYLVKDQGPSCVDPVGNVVEGQPCNTTTACAPGLVCAGTSAPGVCRKACLVSAPACDTGTSCRFITAFPTYGYCDQQ